MEIPCNACKEGYYELLERYDEQDDYAECSICDNSLKLYQFVAEVIKNYGIAIYKWEKQCWKCKCATPVYSYYLCYQLSFFDEDFGTIGAGIGDLPTIDQYLAKLYPHIKRMYSKTITY